MTKSELLTKIAQTPDERQLLARICDQMDHAQRGVPAATPFLSPAQQEAAQRRISAAGTPRHLWSGGFPDAERKVCAFLPDWQEEDTWEPPFTALRCWARAWTGKRWGTFWWEAGSAIFWCSGNYPPIFCKT